MTTQEALDHLLREAHANQLTKRLHPGDAREVTQKVVEAGNAVAAALKAVGHPDLSDDLLKATKERDAAIEMAGKELAAKQAAEKALAELKATLIH